MPRASLTTLRAIRNAHLSWANTPDRKARTAAARSGLEAKFLNDADGDPKRAESLRKAFYADLAIKSVEARRRRAAQTKELSNAVGQFAELGGEVE